MANRSRIIYNFTPSCLIYLDVGAVCCLLSLGSKLRAICVRALQKEEKESTLFTRLSSPRTLIPPSLLSSSSASSSAMQAKLLFLSFPFFRNLLNSVGKDTLCCPKNSKKPSNFGNGIGNSALGPLDVCVFVCVYKVHAITLRKRLNCHSNRAIVNSSDPPMLYSDMGKDFFTCILAQQTEPPSLQRK
ncbi:hypothetical protein TcWFU_006051 [Taenia crassiceps]|uniref:Uncharacterized protein n=1 Tax=Taenia crassiceps TaxID=6207 RepID=A0ABR4Q6D5_9CEST